jgi:predicted peptidase
MKGMSEGGDRALATTMVLAVWLIAGSLLLGGCATHRDWALAPGQHAESVGGVVRKQVNVRFLLYLPQGFTRAGNTRYPLLVFLHGSGESGSDIEQVKKHGPPQFLQTRADFPFIVVSPQADNARTGFDPDAMNLLLDELLRRLPVDRQRIYLTGLSMGGYMAYGWASAQPERFAAIAPVSGAFDPDDACKLKSVPIWAFHGATDDVVKTADDQAMVDAIKACGGDIRFTVYPDVGHWAWDPAYADPKLYEWLLEHRRGGGGR